MGYNFVSGIPGAKPGVIPRETIEDENAQLKAELEKLKAAKGEPVEAEIVKPVKEAKAVKEAKLDKKA